MKLKKLLFIVLFMIFGLFFYPKLTFACSSAADCPDNQTCVIVQSNENGTTSSCQGSNNPGSNNCFQCVRGGGGSSGYCSTYTSTNGCGTNCDGCNGGGGSSGPTPTPVPASGTLNCNPSTVVINPASGTGNATVTGTYNNIPQDGHLAQLCAGPVQGANASLMDQEGNANGQINPSNQVNVSFITPGSTTFYLYNNPILWDSSPAGTNGKCTGTQLASCTIQGITPTPTSPVIPTRIIRGNSCHLNTTEVTFAGSFGYVITNELKIDFAGFPNTNNLWVERKDGAQIGVNNLYSSQSGFAISELLVGSKYYYKVGTCPDNGTSCSVNVDTPSEWGDYYLWCDNIDTNTGIGCSGNPNCSYKNPSSSQVCDPSKYYECASDDNRAPVSGYISTNSPGLAPPFPINATNQCQGPPPGTTSDANGYFLYDNLTVGQPFCVRPSTLIGYSPVLTTNSTYNSYLGSPLGRSSYECQKPGGKFLGSCSPPATYDQYDLISPDSAYDFVENLLPSITATPTPTPTPVIPTLTGITCSLTTNNPHINSNVTWGVNGNAGDSNIAFQWKDSTPAHSAYTAPSSSRTWTTTYTSPAIVTVTLMATDPGYATLITNCAGNITIPSSIDVNGDVHSNN